MDDRTSWYHYMVISKMKHRDKTIQVLYASICKDSGYTLDVVSTATLAGSIMRLHPLAIWIEFPSYQVMEDIAKGKGTK